MPTVNRFLENPDHLLVGAPTTQILPELHDPSDIESLRFHGIAPFIGTSLDPTLRSLGARTVIAAGVSLNRGIMGISIEGVDHGYSVVVPRRRRRIPHRVRRNGVEALARWPDHTDNRVRTRRDLVWPLSLCAHRSETAVSLSVADHVLVGVAALAGGGVNALAGGGTLITFPALVAAGVSVKAAEHHEHGGVVPRAISAAPTRSARIWRHNGIGCPCSPSPPAWVASPAACCCSPPVTRCSRSSFRSSSSPQ